MNTRAKISSIYCQQTFNISKSYLRCAMLNVFNLTDKVVDSNALSYYKLTKSASAKALEVASKGYICKDDNHFIVVYHGCTRWQCKQYKMLLLSYRAAQPEYELPAYVLIKPYYVDGE